MPVTAGGGRSGGDRASAHTHHGANASAVERSPANFIRMRARRTGPSYRNGDRAQVTATGGQSTHRSTATSSGRPHLTQPGGSSNAMFDQQSRQNGHDPCPHPTHRGGKKTSRTLRNAQQGMDHHRHAQ